MILFLCENWKQKLMFVSISYVKTRYQKGYSKFDNYVNTSIFGRRKIFATTIIISYNDVWILLLLLLLLFQFIFLKLLKSNLFKLFIRRRLDFTEKYKKKIYENLQKVFLFQTTTNTKAQSVICIVIQQTKNYNIFSIIIPVSELSHWKGS